MEEREPAWSDAETELPTFEVTVLHLPWVPALWFCWAEPGSSGSCHAWRPLLCRPWRGLAPLQSSVSSLFSQCYKSSKDHSPQLDVNLLGSSVVHKEKQVRKKEHKLKITPMNADVIVLGLQSKDQAEQWLRVREPWPGGTGLLPARAPGAPAVLAPWLSPEGVDAVEGKGSATQFPGPPCSEWRQPVSGKWVSDSAASLASSSVTWTWALVEIILFSGL